MIKKEGDATDESTHKDYYVRGGRNAFRLAAGGRQLTRDLEEMDMDELRRQQLAMRSFTESVEMDTPPATSSSAHLPEGPEESSSMSTHRRPSTDSWSRNAFYDHDRDEERLEWWRNGCDDHSSGDIGMRASSTVDTIIEVVKANAPDASPVAKETMGETQKYVMTVPGPGHLDQEIELHASLLRHGADASPDRYGVSAVPGVDTAEDDDEEFALDAELHRVTAMAEEAERAFREATIGTESNPNTTREENETEACQRRVRDAYNRMAASRPRPTTPTSSCITDGFVERYTNEDDRRVVGSASTSSFSGESGRMRLSIPSKRRSTFSNVESNVTPRWKTDTGIDLLETNQEYARNAPRKPVVHRRASVDWENFTDENAPPRTETSRIGNVDVDAVWNSSTVASDSGRTAVQSSDADCSFKDDEWLVSALIDRNMDETNDKRQKDRIQKEMATPPSSPAPDATGASTRNDYDDEARKISHQLAEDVARRLSAVAVPSTEAEASEEVGETLAETCNTYETTDAFPLGVSSTSVVPPATSITPVRTAPPPPPLPAQSHTEEQQQEYWQQQSQYQQGQEQPSFEQQQEYWQQQQNQYQPTSEQQTFEQQQQQNSELSENQQTYDNSYGQYGTDYSNAAQEQSYGNTYDSSYATQQYGYDTSAYGQYGTSTYDANTNANPFGDYGGYSATTTQSYQSFGAYGDPLSTADYGNVSSDYSGYDTGVYNQSSTVGTEDYNQYGTTDPYAAYAAPPLQYDASSQQQYGDVTVMASMYGQEPNSVEPTPIEQPPPAPLLAPLLPPQRARTPDPFSWEVQASAYEKLGTAVAPPRPPPIAPSPDPSSIGADSQTPTVEPTTDSENEVTDASKVSGSTSPQPPRPKAPPSRPPAPAPARPPAPPAVKAQPTPAPAPAEEEEEDPWARFKQMTEQASNAVKSTTEQLKTLSKTTAANEIKDESYLAQVGGSQGFELNAAQKQILLMQEEKKKAKIEKKKLKAAGKRSPSPTFDPNREAELEKQAAELVKRMAATRADLSDWKPPSDASTITASAPGEHTETKKSKSAEQSDNVKDESIEPKKDDTAETAGAFADFCSEEALAVTNTAAAESPALEETPRLNWAEFSADRAPAQLPNSDSDFFAKAAATAVSAASPTEDPFAPSLMEDNYDPFDIRPAEEVIEAAKKHANAELDVADISGSGAPTVSGLSVSRLSSPTPEGGSPASSRPTGFDDDFRVEHGEYSHTPTPLYDEDDTLPLEDYIPQRAEPTDGWELMLRHPLKKKIMTERFWKPCYVCIQDNMILIYNDKNDTKPYQEIMLQASYSLSSTTLQAYDEFGKIHTIKLQHILYKERVGIRPGQISRLVEGHVTKYGLPLEHAAQTNVLAKFGSLNEDTLSSFVHCVEDILFKCPAKRQNKPIYKQDEVQIHCYDEYRAHVDKDGMVSDQRARVRFFCLAFLTGSPFVELGLNDRRREGKEIVRRKDILPMYTERWIRFEGIEFHNTVDKAVFDEDQVIRFQPPDGCFFEIMRFRVRPPKNREKPLTVKPVMKIAGSKVEIKIKTMAAAQTQRSRGTLESTRTIPCEDIQIRFPIPETWIYIFREERHWGVGSVHSKTRRTGKVKNLRDRLMGTVQHTEATLIEVAIGEAKYEHLTRSLVWRIPRLPEKHHDAYKTHLLKCRFELSSFDLMPEDFKPTCEVDFTMPLATISNTVVRSVAIEQHEDSDRVEKFVRYVAKCHYVLDIDYIHCNDLDEEIVNANIIPELQTADAAAEKAKHVSAFDLEQVNAQHAGYIIDAPPIRTLAEEWADQNGGSGIELQGYGGDGVVSSATTTNGGGGFGAFAGGENQSSSSEDESNEKSHKVPMVEINMQGYGY